MATGAELKRLASGGARLKSLARERGGEPPIPDVTPNLESLGMRPQPGMRDAAAEFARGGLSRGTFETVGGMVGGVAGIPATFAGGPIIGGALGVAAGSAAFDLLRELRGEDVGTSFDVGERAAKEAVTDIAFNLGFTGAGRAISGGRQLVSRLSGIGPQGEQAAKEALEQGVQLSRADVSNLSIVQKSANILGRFPLLRRPFVKAAERKGYQLLSAKERLFLKLGPSIEIAEAGENLHVFARQEFKAFRNHINGLYEDARNIARQTEEAHGAFTPTDSLKEAAAEAADELARRAPLTKGGKRIGGTTLRKEIEDFVEDIQNLDDFTTIEKIDGLMDEFDSLMVRARNDGLSVNSLLRIKGGARQAINDIPPQFEEVKQAFAKADQEFAELSRTFETPTAQRVGRVQKNLFNVRVLDAPGTKDVDELFDIAFNDKSAQSMRDLRKLVGEKQFRQAFRVHLDNAFDAARDAAKNEQLFDPTVMAKRLGLLNKRSKEYTALAEALKGTGVKPSDLEQFLKVADKAFTTGIPNASEFIARRATLGGFRSAVRAVVGSPLAQGAAAAGGGALGAVTGGVSIPMTVVGILTVLKTADILASPLNIKLATRALDTTIPASARRQAVLRLVRQFPELLSDETSPEDSLVGGS